ncbi:MAG: hypothetical protein ACYC6N_29155 [Pirellulaceae bacterium]
MDNLSFNTRKSLCNQLGDIAGNELADYLLRLKGWMEHNKVDRMPVVPETPSSRSLGR